MSSMSSVSQITEGLSNLEMPSLVKLGKHKERTNILFSTTRLKAGVELLCEAPLIVIPDREDLTEWARPLPTHIPENFWAYYMGFLDQSETIKEIILSFYAPNHGKKTSHLRALACNALSEKETELFVKVAMVFECNATEISIPYVDESIATDGASLADDSDKITSNASVDIQTDGLETESDTLSTSNKPIKHGMALFNVSCRAAHSCQPNCWSFSTTDGNRIIRTIVPIAENEELTVDYTHGNNAIKPTNIRRAYLLESWHFVCECPRCVAEGDDTRRFPCSIAAASGCEGYHLARNPIQSETSSSRFLLPCQTCGQVSSPEHTKRVIGAESELEKEVAEIDHVLDNPPLPKGIQSRIDALCVPHAHHYLAALIAGLKREAGLGRMVKFPGMKLVGIRTRGREEFVHSLEAEMDCLDTLYPFPNQEIAILCEKLGDFLSFDPLFVKAKGLPKSCNISQNPAVLKWAQNAYRRAARILSLTEGPESLFATEIVRKLVVTQTKLPYTDVSLRLLACGLCGKDEQPLMRCSRCHLVVFCCKKHQRAQWCLHQRHCRSDK